MSFSNTKTPYSKPTSYINLDSFNYASDPVDSIGSILQLDCIHFFYQG